MKDTLFSELSTILTIKQQEDDKNLKSSNRFNNNEVFNKIADKEFIWDELRTKAVLMETHFGQNPAECTPPKIARKLGLTFSEYKEIREHPIFRRAVSDFFETLWQSNIITGVATIEGRVTELKKRHAMLQSIIESNQEAQYISNHTDGNGNYNILPGTEDVSIPGLETGYLQVRRKEIVTGRGTEARIEVTTEAYLNTTILKELRAIEEMIAVELGQRKTTVSLIVPGKRYCGVNVDDV